MQYNVHVLRDFDRTVCKGVYYKPGQMHEHDVNVCIGIVDTIGLVELSAKSQCFSVSAGLAIQKYSSKIPIWEK